MWWTVSKGAANQSAFKVQNRQHKGKKKNTKPILWLGAFGLSNKINFHIKGTRTCFETEAKGNSEIIYWICSINFSFRRCHIFGHFSQVCWKEGASKQYPLHRKVATYWTQYQLKVDVGMLSTMKSYFSSHLACHLSSKQESITDSEFIWYEDLWGNMEHLPKYNYKETLDKYLNSLNCPWWGSTPKLAPSYLYSTVDTI